MFAENFNVNYINDFLSSDEAYAAFDELLSAPFITPTFTIRGGYYMPNRRMTAYGDAGINYTFSGTTLEALPWTPLLREMKSRVENVTGDVYNYVLINYYPDGNSKISAHKDDEKSLDPETSIPCISLGATRKVIFRRNGFAPKKTELTSGSLYIMSPPTNVYWTHEIPAESEVREGRISLSFRNIRDPSSAIPSSVSAQNSTPDSNEPHIKNMKLELSENDSLGEQLKIDLDTYDIFSTISFQLSETLFCRVVEFNGSLRIDLRRFRIEKLRRIPSKEGIVMESVNWFHFCSKLSSFNFVYNDTSFIVNNAIIAMKHGKGLHLQQINCESELPFLKDTFIQLLPYEVEKLLEREEEITECLIDGIWGYQLPRKLRSVATNLPSPYNSDNELITSSYFKYIENHIRSQVRPLFYCEGCVVESYSHFNHDCSYKSTKDIFESLGRRAWLLVNIHELTNEMDNNFAFIWKNLTTADYKQNIFSEDI